ncbi:SDR family oxidoreductase [Salinispira pacifica]
MKLSDRVVWITGASSGIGRALAIALAGRGARLILTARRLEKLQEVKGETGLPEKRVVLLPADLSRLEGIENLSGRAVQAFGRVDVLINNAGISQRSTASETGADVMHRIMDVDFFAPALLSKSLLPALAGQRESMIVVVSSVAGKLGTQLRSTYSAAKHALHGYFEALRLETFRENVRIQLVVAGYIRTEISRHALRGDGSAHGVMDDAQVHGTPPEKAAEQIIRAMERNRMEVKVGLDARTRFALALNALWPAMLFRLLRNAKVT